MPRIFWTNQETMAVAGEFVRLRKADPFSGGIALLQQAEGVLDPNRQRGLATMSEAKLVAEAAKRLWADEMEVQAHPARAEAPAPPPAESSRPPPPAPPAAPEKPREPLVIEIRAEKSDLQATLASCPTSILLGAAIERLLSSRLREQPPAIETVRVQASQPTPAKVSAPLILADSVQGGATLPDPAEKDVKRVLIIGLLPSAADIVRSKTTQFANLSVAIESDALLRGAAPVQCDYVILMQGLVTSFQAAQIRRRFTDPSRVIHFEGATAELIQRLADMNSGRPVRAP